MPLETYYPENWLSGFSPLIFAVNAICDEGNHREYFDRFLQALTATFIAHNNDQSLSSSSAVASDGTNAAASSSSSTDRRRTIALFRSDDDEEETSDEDDLILPASHPQQQQQQRRSLRTGFGLVGRSHDHAAATAAAESAANPATSYAKALKQGIPGFFQRARIVSVSAKYGFPPSKNPDGTLNLALELQQAFKCKRHDERQNAIVTAFATYPLTGILDAGWLEKHVHALPSAIVVVCTVSGRRTLQHKQDQILFETTQHLQYSLVPKRHCGIQIVGILLDDVTDAQADEWAQAILHDSEENAPDTHVHVTLLRLADIAIPPEESSSSSSTSSHSENLQTFHKIARNASLRYYRTQARRNKEKLVGILLGIQQQQQQTTPLRHKNHAAAMVITHKHPAIALAPLFIRYCFKIAIFYEFQNKYEKAFRYWTEAYRYVVHYYQWVLSKQQQHDQQPLIIISDATTEDALLVDDDRIKTTTTRPATSPTTNTMADENSGTGIEIEYNNFDDPSLSSSSSSSSILSNSVPPPPSDILYQIRELADWLNLKLLNSGFASHTEGGLLAASNQWRMHCRTFATPRRTPSTAIAAAANNNNNNFTHPFVTPIEEWYEWSFIARQRIVISQLVERHPPTALGNSNNEYAEVVLRCSPWRNYASAAEAMLQLGYEIAKTKQTGQYPYHTCNSCIPEHSHPERSSSDGARARFVGGLTSAGLTLDFQKECRISHREKALELILSAISMYERELQREKRGFYAEDPFRERSSSRTGARLYYLAGGILLGMGRHEESAVHLTKAAKYAQGWSELELAVRRMLIECYEKYIPSQSDMNESSQNLVSVILDSYFNAKMTSRDLRRALDHFVTISGGENNTLKWYHDTTEEDDSSQPFSFAVSFPGRTHATSGETVKASVLIKSNLDYAVHVNSASLLSLAGKLVIPSMDLLSAANASEGTDGGIIIQAKTAIVVSTKVNLPKDISIIASDESGNGGESQGVAGKGSFAKNAKPRTAGLTAAGGARLVSEEKLRAGNTNAQGWNMRFLGGKPLLCNGLNLIFYPVQAEKVSGGAEKVTLIDLTIEKMKRKTAANIKRTPFEEENYIASAWSRPLRLHLSRGPRSLRVLGPSPQLVITNMTETLANGKAIEGTVNRILIKLQAGPNELCSNVNVDVSCFSVLLKPNGSTKRLVSKEEVEQAAENSIDMTNPMFRTPVLVSCQSVSMDKQDLIEYGYPLPFGWKVSGSGQKGSSIRVPNLRGEESAFIHLDFYRPAGSRQKPISEGDDDFQSDIDDDVIADVSLCKTDYYVTVTYRQEGPPTAKPQRTRRQSRRRPVMLSGNKDSVSSEDNNAIADPDDPLCDDDGEFSSEVSLEYSGSIVWAPPMAAKFCLGTKKGFPSGNRHPSNRIENSSPANECVIVAGQNVSVRCSLELDRSMEGLKTEIVAVHYNNVPDSPFSTSLLPKDLPSESLIYKGEKCDPCRILSSGDKLGIGYSILANLKDQKLIGASSQLGSILVDWKPLPFEVPIECPDHIGYHGPLALSTPSAIHFRGPPCYVENAPFEVHVFDIPNPLSVATPFDVSFSIRNNSKLHQGIQIRLFESDKDFLLVSGITNGGFCLAPNAIENIQLTCVAVRPGEFDMPRLQVTSDRYQSWIIRDFDRSLFVMP